MKQSEMDRKLRLLSKAAAKAQGWKFVAGMAYWTVGPLFFTLTPYANAKEGGFFCTLRFKWLALDRVFWRVMDLSDNEHAPFSLHANGAFVLPGQQLLEIAERGLDWQPGVLEQQVHDAFARGAARAAEVAAQISSLATYLDVIQREHAALMEKHPGALVNLHKELLLAAMIDGDLARAATIARERIAENDWGGYMSDSKTFYQLALALLTGPQATVTALSS